MSEEEKAYHPEPYWSEVADRIASREDQNVIAGDDEPFYRYKRTRFLELLRSVDFSGRRVLEVGSGPGGNLRVLSTLGPRELHAVDISQSMLDLARKNNAGNDITFHKINGTQLPFDDQFIDIAITATVLQHNTDHAMMRQLLGEICRSTREKVVLFEQTNPTLAGDELCYWRPISDYAEVCEKQGFQLVETEYINIYTSYLFCGAVRKLLNPRRRQEGEPLNQFSHFLENISLPLTKQLDKVFKAKTDLTKLVFVRS
ncbi:MAG: class I SAM-dependent methyltransferase [Bacteroidota bacterium]